MPDNKWATTSAPPMRTDHSFPQIPLGVGVLDRQTVLRPEQSRIEFPSTEWRLLVYWVSPSILNCV
jgi:hypothetical protein